MINSRTLSGKVVSLKAGEAAAWRRELLPLPHELTIKQVLRLKPGTVTIKGRLGTSGLEKAAVTSLAELFRQKTGIAPEGKHFEILIGLIEKNGRLEGIDLPLAARLKKVPNRDQAYVIQPVGNTMLAVAALTDRGLYYGTRTLAQWFEFHLTKKAAEIPLATIVDWPDLEERGFWHMPVSLIPWLASLKMNRFFMSHWFNVDKTGIQPTSIYNEPDPKIRQAWTPPYEKARMFAADAVPGPSHMDFWESRCRRFREAFPHLIGKGESAKDPFTFPTWPQRVPCASHPDLVKILTAVMTGLAKQKASEVMVWTSEYPHAFCECPKCRKEGQYRAETRAAVEAWQAVKKTYPDLKLSVFFGRGGFLPPPERRYPDRELEDIMASLPPDVAMRPSMGCDGPDGKLMKKFAARGKRISRMYVVFLSASFTSEDVRERMESIVADNYIGAWQFTPGGYKSAAAFQQKMLGYRLNALAEYAWNVRGRSEKDFAAAWAAREGLKNPAGFVEWIEAMRMPQALRMPVCCPGYTFESWFGSLKDMTARRKWDKAHFKPGEPEAGIKKCARGLALAKKLGEQDCILYAQVMLEYCRLEQAGYKFISSLANKAAEKAASEAFAQLKEALKKYAQARDLISFTSCSALESELEKVSVELTRNKT